MFKKFAVLSGLLALILALTAPLTAVAQEPLTEEYTSPSGLSLSYPAAWAVQADSGMLALTNDPAAFDSDIITANAVGVVVIDPGTIAMVLGGAGAESPADAAAAIAMLFSDGDAQPGAVEETTIGDRPAARLTAAAEDGDIEVLVIDFGAAGYAAVITVLPPGEANQFASTIDAIAASIAYTPPWQAMLTGHTDYVQSVAFSPDGTQLASGSEDGTARIWDVATGAEVLSMEHPDYVRSVAFSPDGSLIVTGADDGVVRLWDAATGDSVAELSGHTDYVRGVAFSPDGYLIASGSDDGTVRLWAFNDGWQEQAVLSGHTDYVQSVAFSPDGAQLASGSDDGTARIWDVATGAEVLVMEHPDYVRSVAFSPDGSQIVTGSDDGIVRVWDAATGDLDAELTGHTDYVRGVAISPDGRWIASGSDDRTVRLWAFDDGWQEQAVFEGHNDWVRTVAFSPDSALLASGADDGSIILWNVP